VSEGRSAAKTRTPLKMVKQATKRRRTQAGKEERTCRKWTARLTGTGQVPWPSTFAQDMTVRADPTAAMPDVEQN